MVALAPDRAKNISASDRNAGGFAARPADTFENVAATNDKDYSSTPFVSARGITYTQARGVILHADDTVTLYPVGDEAAGAVAIPLKAGIEYAIAFGRIVAGAAGDVTVLF